MEITLISTSTFPSDQGIRTLSSVLKKEGYKVNLVFMTLSEDYSRNYTEKELWQLYEICKNSKLIGINSYASTDERAKRIIEFIEKNLYITTVLGGVHATIFPEKCLEYAKIVCIGEGEQAIRELADSIKTRGYYTNIKNLWIKQSVDEDTDKIIKNEIKPLIENLDDLPFPDYDIETHFILDKGKIRKFEERDLSGGIFFLTGRGCPYGCHYCSNSFFNKLYQGKCKSILRWYSPEYIIKGILYLKNKFPSLKYFDIRDDTFSLRPLEDIKKFCQLYKEKVKMRFKCLADPKTITDEKIRLLVDAGCTDIIVGIQGCERTNKEIYHRNQTDKDVLIASKILNRYKNKLTVMYDVITCNPYENPKDIINLIKLLQKLPKPYYLSVNNLIFFPGSELYNKAIFDGTIKSEGDTFCHLNYWDRSKHILSKRKNIYLNLVLNLMRGKVSEKRFGFMPNFLLNILLKEKRIEWHLRHSSLSIFACRILSLFDFAREKILKPIYRSMPISFKVWYDKRRYK